MQSWWLISAATLGDQLTSTIPLVRLLDSNPRHRGWEAGQCCLLIPPSRLCCNQTLSDLPPWVVTPSWQCQSGATWSTHRRPVRFHDNYCACVPHPSSTALRLQAAESHYCICCLQLQGKSRGWILRTGNIVPQNCILTQWGLDKSTLIHRWRCDASQTLKVAH